MGKKHGFGIEEVDNGHKFIGMFSHDKKKGWGELINNIYYKLLFLFNPKDYFFII